MPLFKLIKGHVYTRPYILMWKKVHNNQNNLTVLEFSNITIFWPQNILLKILKK